MREQVGSNWRKAILVCAKCSKKVRGGFGKTGKSPLARELRALSNGKKGRKADFGVIETRCLKLCPKKRVVVVDTARPGQWSLVEPGTPIDDIVVRLGLDTGSSPANNLDGSPK